MKIINENNTEEKSKYPELPFVVKDRENNLYLITIDNDNCYRYINLTYEDEIRPKGKILNASYETLEDMFKENPRDIIMDSELHILGEYNK